MVDTYIYFPRSDTEKAELAKRVSAVHADYVIDYVNKLDCADEQKKNLLESILKNKGERHDG